MPGLVLGYVSKVYALPDLGMGPTPE